MINDIQKRLTAYVDKVRMAEDILNSPACRENKLE